LRELTEHTGVSPADTGGDVDADGQRAQSSGEESVGGSVATPDQSVVDELARPLGVERATGGPGHHLGRDPERERPPALENRAAYGRKRTNADEP